MKNKLKFLSISAAVAVLLLLAFSACGKTETAASISSSAPEVGASSETETNQWFDEEAYHARLEAAGIPYKLNDDGSKPAEWTIEYYEMEKYAQCDGISTDDEGYILMSESLYEPWYELTGIDPLPEEQLWAMSTADFKRAVPDVEPPTEADLERFKAEAQKYLEGRGAGEYPFQFSRYHATFDDNLNTSKDQIQVYFTFRTDRETEDLDWPEFHCVYSTDGYVNQGYHKFKEAFTCAYGEAEYEKIHEKLAAGTTLVNSTASNETASS